MAKRWLLLGGVLLCAVAFWALRQADTGPIRSGDELQVGGLYSVEGGGGSYAIAKVLALEPTLVGVLVYPERFTMRVRDDTPASLVLSSLRGSDGAQSGYRQLAPDAFLASRPIFIRQASVEPTELAAYEQWKVTAGADVRP